MDKLLEGVNLTESLTVVLTWFVKDDNTYSVTMRLIPSKSRSTSPSIPKDLQKSLPLPFMLPDVLTEHKKDEQFKYIVVGSRAYPGDDATFKIIHNGFVLEPDDLKPVSNVSVVSEQSDIDQVDKILQELDGDDSTESDYIPAATESIMLQQPNRILELVKLGVLKKTGNPNPNLNNELFMLNEGDE